MYLDQYLLLIAKLDFSDDEDLMNEALSSAVKNKENDLAALTSSMCFDGLNLTQ